MNVAASKTEDPVVHSNRQPPCKKVDLISTNRSLGLSGLSQETPRCRHQQYGPPGFVASPNAASIIAHGFRTFPKQSNANEILLHLNKSSLIKKQRVTNDYQEEDQPQPSTQQQLEPPMLSEHDAKRQIQLIFRTPACWRSESDQNHLLYLLQQFPVLATQFYDWDFNLFWKHGNERTTPLPFLIASGASLEAIELAYELYPKAISQFQGVNRDLPLHFACRYSAPDDVVAFLAHRFPLAVMTPNASGMLPLHCAMGKKHAFPYGKFQRASLATVRLLVEMYPESLLVEEKEKFYTPLQIAFNHGYSFEVIDYMMSRIPAYRMKEFKLIGGCYHKLFSVNLDLAESELVSKLLPSLERFHCEPTDWTVDGLVQLLKYLQHNTSISEFSALNIRHTVLIDPSVLSALEKFLENNNTIEHLRISVNEHNQGTSVFLQKLIEALQKNRALKCLELTSFSVTARSLAEFLANENAPISICLNKCAIGTGETTDGGQTFVKSPTEKLVFSDCCLDYGKNESRRQISSFLSALSIVARMISLKALTIQCAYLSNVNITAPIVELLEKSKSIESISINGPSLDMELLCRVLQFNNTLKILDAPKVLESKVSRGCLAYVLENHNSTLQYARIFASIELEQEEEFQKVEYFTRLNQYGRAQVQDPSTKNSSFVKLLQNLRALLRVSSTTACLSVQYGLLREAPSLWCTNEATYMNDKDDDWTCRRKRRRED